MTWRINKPGPAQVGPISKAQKSKRTSKCQFTVLENRKTKKNGPSGAPGPACASPWRAKRGTLPKLSTFLSQLKGGPFGEKTNFRKKVSQSRKTERGDPLVSPGMVCYAEKQEKPFWFSSLGQMVQFGAIIFCRTFKNYFGQFVWIENKPGPAQVGAISKAQK